jgi:histidinol-phosphatase (PHP family)
MINLTGRGIALEINTSGLRREHFCATMPSFDLLKIYKDMGGELLTLGSDSHGLEQLADIRGRFASVYAKLLEIGFRYTSIIKNKRFEQIKIEL